MFALVLVHSVGAGGVGVVVHWVAGVSPFVVVFGSGSIGFMLVLAVAIVHRLTGWYSLVLLYSAVAALDAGSHHCSSIDWLVFAGVVVFGSGGTGFTLVLAVIVVH